MPFTVEQFLDVFGRYNEAIWPLQLLFLILAGTLIALGARSGSRSGRWIMVSIAFLWAWMAVVYHWGYFAAINRAAYVFGALFLVEGGLVLHIAMRSPPSFRARLDAPGIAGAILIVYAVAIYPILGYALGHRYPRTPTFGLPCPTTIFTFGLLLWAERSVPLRLLAIPALWAVIGSLAAVSLTISEDYGLLAAAVIGTALIARKRRQLSRAAMVAPQHRDGPPPVAPTGLGAHP